MLLVSVRVLMVLGPTAPCAVKAIFMRGSVGNCDGFHPVSDASANKSCPLDTMARFAGYGVVICY